MRISDWSSDVCSSDLARRERAVPAAAAACLLPMEVFPIRSAGTVRARQAEDLCDRLGSVVHREFPLHDRGLRADALDGSRRTEERRVGKECVRTCTSAWAPYHQQKQK